MNKITLLLYEYINNHISEMTEAWYSTQILLKASPYSYEISPTVINKVKDQIGYYFTLMTEALIQPEEEMVQSINEWTKAISTERMITFTSLHDSIYTVGTMRIVYWEFIEKFVKENPDNITFDDLFYWQNKINRANDCISETYTDNYMNLLLNKLNHQAALINDLSSPVITLTKEIGLLPLTGEFDSERVSVLSENVLHKSVNASISTLIIDLSGVYVVDTIVAHQLFQLIKSLKIVGIDSILTGLRPEIAQTAIKLGLNFTGIRTVSNLEKALSLLKLK